MKKLQRSRVAVILTGYNVWAVMCLFRGFYVSSLPLLAVFTAMGLSLGTAVFPFMLGCSLTAVLSPSLMPWAVLVSGLLSSVAGSDMKTRAAGFTAVALSLWLSPVSFSIPLAAVAALGAVTSNERIRYAYIPLAFLVAAFLTGLPGPLNTPVAIARSEIAGGTITYDIPELNTSRPEAVLPAPFQGNWVLWIALESGGVRDSLPMLAVYLGESMQVLPAGTDTFTVTVSPGDSVSLFLMREFTPFNHTAVHASAGGELL
jgi:hypothetical protein